MRDDQKNLFLAMGLSLVVIVGWQYFFPPAPPPKPAVTQQATAPQTAPAQPGAPATTTAPSSPVAPGAPTVGAPSAPAVPLVADRKTALAASPRIAIDTPALSGSIALRGGRLDDVSLKNYRETIKPNSDIIHLLSPAGSADPYYVETGFVSTDARLALPRPDTVWTAQGGDLTPGKPVVLTWDNGQGLVFTRTFSVDTKYLFTVKDTVENKTAAPVALHPYALVHRIGKPKTDGYYVLHEGLIGIVGDSKIQELTYDAIAKEKDGARTMKGTGGWLGMTDKYWAAAVVPPQNAAFDARFSVTNPTSPKPAYQTDALGAAQTVAPGASYDSTHLVFAGAKESFVIDDYQKQAGIKNFELIIDWGWFYFITKPLFVAIDWIYKYTGNFGIAILLITVLIKGAFFPLANRSYESMAKMKAVQPQMKEIQERYASDKQKLQQEMMALYKKERINPIAGCWPILIQIPVFFALYKVIFITIEMRHAPFVGWIKDLSAADPTNIFNLFGLIPFDPTQIPALGPYLHIGIWPLIMGVSMFIQMKMNPEPTDPVQKSMFAWMPVIFTFMLGSFPAGLVIYWTWNNLLSVAQQYFIMKKQGVKVELWDNLAGLFKKKAA